MIWWQGEFDDQQIGDYRIDQLLGQDGLAEVFLAAAISGRLNERTVVVKIPSLCKFSSDHLPMLLSYSKPQRDLSIPRLMAILDAEYRPGGNLERRLGGLPGKRERKQSVEEVLKQSVAEAVDGCHVASTAFLHRDFKLSSILFNKHGRAFLDFSSVPTKSTLRRGVTDLSSTGEGDVPGTSSYIAIGHLQGHPGPRSDQFGLAATDYESLSSKLPVSSDNAHDYVTGLILGRSKSLREYPPDLSPNVFCTLAGTGGSRRTRTRTRWPQAKDESHIRTERLAIRKIVAPLDHMLSFGM